ncbi:hypothetical protein DFR50_105173 [Roseiarcus fermentans]|uniref:Uncharacterized protein n=1 Tax=Roseiarcus fermentans TaxID=1473586 RepID=A0A366FR55_9HYPH|nr:hypothetical protein [Roseiarcus fermentans]RBP16530.1 hypothetical protein DFR50_105173 [Roseiarcus fermentans]
MTRIAVFAVVSAGLAAIIDGSVADPASWAIVLAGVAGSEYLSRRSKTPIGIED